MGLRVKGVRDGMAFAGVRTERAWVEMKAGS